MKKKLVGIIIILIILMNIFSFIHINKNLVNNLLFDKTIVTFVFNEKSNLDENFLNEIGDFSKEKDIEIAQYSFLSGKKIDIYSTMENRYKGMLFIPNLIFNKDIKVHNFKAVYNVGFKNLFYIDTKDKDVINEFAKDFNKYGIIYDLGSKYEGDESFFNNFIKYIDVNFVSVLILFLFIFVLIILFYYLNNKKDYLIYELWGYSKIQIYCILNKILYKTLFITIFACNLVMIGIIYIFNLTSMLFKFIPITIVLNLVVVLLLFLFSVILFALSFANLNNKDEKKRLSKIRFIASLSKFCLILLIILLFKNFSNEKSILKKNQDSLGLWENTENLFNICAMYSPIYEDLALEGEHNDKVLKVYKDLSRLNKVFIINSINFERSRILNPYNEEIDYTYKGNIKNKEDLYSPHGRNIMVDKNYLKRHLIKTSFDKKNVLDKIDYNDDVLNVLVPQKLKKHENTIKKTYREWFYFQKVHVSNMYKEASNQKLSKKKIDDLKINLIYIQNNQAYFTYNSNAGDYLNMVKDPIVTVYTENVDNSILASTLGGAIFLESKNEYSALEEIKNITQRYNVYELNAILSVYDKKGQEISQIEDKIDRLMLNIIIVSVILTLLMIVITYVYYKSYISKIIIKSLYGYNFITTYKDLLLSNLFMYILVFLLLIIIYKKIYIYTVIVTISMLFIDFIIARTVNVVLLNKGEIKFIKGELK
ncbi:DUF1430 domain-containing protein [Anaerosalibacter bizertensis]|uniref:DUF1430 domain-containing protein n=1 Tax=Anaerosalibacter bizertensis TaxID=932217 RepID=A0A9Q4AC90_9FIRM|nr:DUF1430 domain-containing protein [Anaerosalibacter bizertensis]MBV1817890.1 DUF1430 domain-containing protein [Bacteroidales bacterium MSK.15.36]MCB5559491.1 DUF1430 domain-containing protein [Anaerosalibacter bizertensis]MCG4564749.1 DUF1430 domain-containing protein [Anaerosalibacter bizertensis]MCG4582405.1 DUF1430 domain-containing protein [Anaerosalibacter bizertensis]